MKRCSDRVGNTEGLPGAVGMFLTFWERCIYVQEGSGPAAKSGSIALFASGEQQRLYYTTLCNSMKLTFTPTQPAAE